MRAPATPPALRTALADLASVAAGFAVGTGRSKARAALREAIRTANAVLKTGGGTVPVLTVDDPDAWVEAWIAAGGDWCALTAAVNRNALRGSTASRRQGGTAAKPMTIESGFPASANHTDSQDRVAFQEGGSK